MANQEHFILIKQGVEVWNSWREENPKNHPDLSGADLQEADLQGINLENANLKETILFDVNFQGANLQHADLQQANLYEANLTRADLRGANLLKADGLTRFHFENVIFDETTKVPDYVELTKKEEPEFPKIWIFLTAAILTIVVFFILR